MTTSGQRCELTLGLLGRFSVCVDGSEVTIAPNGQRVLAMLGLHGRTLTRSRLAGTIWAATTEKRAQANLRTTVWRLPELIRRTLERQGAAVALDASWSVDIDEAADCAARLAAAGLEAHVDRAVFAADLLPSWDFDWLLVRRERHRQLRLHALETLCDAQLSEGNALDAVDTALQAVDAEPLRESAQILLLRAHAMAGNRMAVVRQYDLFKTELARELGVRPGPDLVELVAAART